MSVTKKKKKTEHRRIAEIASSSKKERTQTRGAQTAVDWEHDTVNLSHRCGVLPPKLEPSKKARVNGDGEALRPGMSKHAGRMGNKAIGPQCPKGRGALIGASQGSHKFAQHYSFIEYRGGRGPLHPYCRPRVAPRQAPSTPIQPLFAEQPGQRGQYVRRYLRLRVHRALAIERSPSALMMCDHAPAQGCHLAALPLLPRVSRPEGLRSKLKRRGYTLIHV
ncbi:unnamed protein product, partial [Iphiclides podalirius]